jgi:hypothetical protein
MRSNVLAFLAAAVIGCIGTFATVGHGAIRNQSASYCLGVNGSPEQGQDGYVFNADGSDSADLACPVDDDDLLPHGSINGINVFGSDAATDESASVTACIQQYSSPGWTLCGNTWFMPASAIGPFVASTGSSPALDVSTWRASPSDFAYLSVHLTKNVVAGGSQLRGFFLF